MKKVLLAMAFIGTLVTQAPLNESQELAASSQEIELREEIQHTTQELEKMGIILSDETASLSDEISPDARITLIGNVTWSTFVKSSSAYYLTDKDSYTVTSATWSPQANYVRFGVVNKNTGVGYWAPFKTGGGISNYKVNTTNIPAGDYYIAISGEYDNVGSTQIIANITP